MNFEIKLENFEVAELIKTYRRQKLKILLS